MSLAIDATEAKRRVLELIPSALLWCDRGTGRWGVSHNAGSCENDTIGEGDTGDEAWIAAAAGLKEERK